MNHVMLIDDDPMIIEMATFLLQQEKEFTLTALTDPDQALAQARKKPPHVFLLDLNLEGVNGADLMQEIQNDPELKSIPVIFLTAESNIDKQKRLIQLGAKGVIQKPFDPKIFTKQIKQMLAMP